MSQADTFVVDAADFSMPDESTLSLPHLTQAERLVHRYMLGAMGAGLVPLPLLDMALVSAIQLKMLHSLTVLYEQPFQADLGRSLIGALLGGALPASASGSLSKFIPGIGQVTGMLSMSVLSAASTYALGKVFIQHFESGGTFLSFDPDAVRDYFAEALEEGKKIAGELHKTEASAEPMK